MIKIKGDMVDEGPNGFHLSMKMKINNKSKEDENEKPKTHLV